MDLHDYYTQLMILAIDVMGIHQHLCFECQESVFLLRSGRYDRRTLIRAVARLELCVQRSLDEANYIVDAQEFMDNLRQFGTDLQLQKEFLEPRIE